MGQSFSSININSSGTDLQIKNQMLNAKRIFHENYIYIPDRFYDQMMATDLIDRLLKVIQDVNRDQKTIPPLSLKREREYDSESDSEIDMHPDKRKKQEDVATQTTTDFQPIYLDPDDSSYENLHPGYTYVY